jgi:plasmid replication initiation protein
MYSYNFHSQDTEKMERLRAAINAQTKYTVLVNKKKDTIFIWSCYAELWHSMTKYPNKKLYSIITGYHWEGH